MYERSRHLMDCHIAGFTYYDGLDVIKELEPGTPVDLRSEPENPYDTNAVSIYYKETKLGYVPRNKNAYICDLLYFGHGSIVTAKISHHDPYAGSEHQFRIAVKIKDKRKK
jgi:hypothetical protein